MSLYSGDDFAARFLINEGCDINTVLPSTNETALHLVASFGTKDESPELLSGMTDIARLLLEKHAEANNTDCQGKYVTVFKTHHC